MPYRFVFSGIESFPIFHVFVSHVKVTCQGDGGFLAKRRGGAMPPGEILPTGVNHASSEFWSSHWQVPTHYIIAYRFCVFFLLHLSISVLNKSI